MCGRFALMSSPEKIARAFGLASPPAPRDPPDGGPSPEPPELWRQRYNAAPTQELPAVLTEAVGEGPPRRVARLLRWGLVPFWADDPSIGNRLINARAESAADRPAFRAAFRQRRCLIPVDGFFEWKKLAARSGPPPEENLFTARTGAAPAGAGEGDAGEECNAPAPSGRGGGRKQPYFVTLREGGPFGLAGLWESWHGPGRARLDTFTVLTTPANDLVRPIHDRMPAIIPAEAYDRWLDPSFEDVDRLRALLRPYPAERMRAYPISTRVNRVDHDDPRILEPFDAASAK